MIDMAAFRDAVGDAGTVCVRGGGTRWLVGAVPSHTGDVRQISAPVGIESIDPPEMTVVVGSGTTVADLASALSEHGQRTVPRGHRW